MTNYWVVGANWGGDDEYDKFVLRGYWALGHSDDAQPDMAEMRNQIRPNDRIAIKRMLGKGSSEIEIRAIGIVKDCDSENNYVYVDWIVTNLNRIVPSNGHYCSIRGPFFPDDEWTRTVFLL